MTAFYELMERCAYQPPDEAVEALAAELGMTAAVARTFVRKELAALAKMAQTRSAHAAMDRGRAVGARAQQRRALRLHALGHVQAQVHALAARAIVADAAARRGTFDREGGRDSGGESAQRERVRLHGGVGRSCRQSRWAARRRVS